MSRLPAWPYSPYIAHRNGGHLAPENTLAAMRVGAAHGFTMFEFDVKLSRDGIAFLLHDDTLDRCTDGQGPAGALDFGQLAQLDAGSWHSAGFAGEPPPSFAAIARFARANDLACNVEIKPCPGQEAETGAAVAQLCAHFWQDAAVPPLLSSFQETSLAEARRVAPQVPRALLVDTIPSDWAQRLAALEAVALNINHRDASAGFVQAIHAAGYRVAAWTINEPGRARELLALGVDAIFTDNLAEIRPA